MVGYVVANHPVPVKIEKKTKTSFVKKFQKGHIRSIYVKRRVSR